ncbi:hypothetical protein [Agrobacterium tumefaciens]|uniref:hypothetical protein n=1 Tax=Agrobacterium tumefaciens TaxID=358 RepID=UPI0011477AF3
MSNIVFLRFHQPMLDDPVYDQTDEVAQSIPNFALPDIMREIEAKLGVMLVCLTELQEIFNNEISGKEVSPT